jgi:hypothetical protein
MWTLVWTKKSGLKLGLRYVSPSLTSSYQLPASKRDFMILSNRERILGGSRCGVIQNRSFHCELVTDEISAIVSSNAGEQDSKKYIPIAEALLDRSLTWKRVREIHDTFLEELDQCGVDGADLGGAIERVFGRARHEHIVTRYQNKAWGRIAAGTIQSKCG